MKTAALWLALLSQAVVTLGGAIKIADELGYLHRYQVGLGAQVASNKP